MSINIGSAPTAIMTVAEVCDLLHIHCSTLYRLIRQGRFPVFKIGSDYRFSREAIYEWMAEKQRAEFDAK